ncbi:hypothetical protein JW826_03305 [Candidatus Woesearchaeota archaeon]|nr:hypothetical protein [Candidatus Woesearchaeota archaeon]
MRIFVTRGIRKGQITMIVIVGLVLLLTFAILLMLRSGSSGKEPASVSKILYELESGLVKDHVTACITKVSSDSVEKFTASGGRLYDFDGGLIPLASLEEGVDYLNYTLGQRTFLVAYGLRENSFCPEISYAIPDFPYLQSNISSLESVYSSSDDCVFKHAAADYDGVLGEVTMPKLCSFVQDSSCRTFAKGKVLGLTVQRQMEDYLERKLPLCVELSNFSEQFNAEISQDGNISVHVSIREDDIQIAVDYPFMITFKDIQPISKVVHYQTSLKVRLGRLYNFLYHILSRDAKEPFFDIRTEGHASSFWVPGFELRKIDNPCKDCILPQRQDDLIEVFDDQSALNGKNLIFRVAMQDRRPVLSYIPDEYYDLNPSASTPVSNSEIQLMAVDPDDTELKYVFMSEGPYGGWREDDNVIYDLDNGMFLKIFFDVNNDLGNHPVYVMIKDEDGLFDYQPFYMNVQDTSATLARQQNCVDDCNNDAYCSDCCEDWCFISRNFCTSHCLGEFKPYQYACLRCVEQVYYSNTPEQHVDCLAIADKQGCIDQMPDCFWVFEPAAEPPNFAGRCVSDRDLKSLVAPVFMEDD